MTDLLFPYHTIGGDISLSVTAADLDGRELSAEQIRTVDRTISVYSLEKTEWKELTLHVTVALPQLEIEAYDEQGKTPAVLVRTNCHSTSARQSMLLNRIENAIWTGTITLPGACYDDRATLDAVITLDDPDRHIIGFSDPWRLDFIKVTEKDPPPPIRSRRLIDCQYTSFSESPLPYLPPHKDLAAYIDLSRAEPTLWLNSDIPGLQVVMDSATGTSSTAEGEMPANEISAKMWTALFNAAVSELEWNDDPESIPAAPVGWPGHVLNRILPQLYPGVSQDEARRNVRNAYRDDDGMRILQSQLVPIIDRIVGYSKTLRTLLRPALRRIDEDNND